MRLTRRPRHYPLLAIICTASHKCRLKQPKQFADHAPSTLAFTPAPSSSPSSSPSPRPSRPWPVLDHQNEFSRSENRSEKLTLSTWSRVRPQPLKWNRRSQVVGAVQPQGGAPSLSTAPGAGVRPVHANDDPRSCSASRVGLGGAKDASSPALIARPSRCMLQPQWTLIALVLHAAIDP